MQRGRDNLGNIAFVLVAAGTLWLLVQIGFVPQSLIDVVGTWWPLFLIGAGLDFMLPRYRPGRVPFTAVACLVVVVLALLGFTRSTAVGTSQVVELGPNVMAADISLRFGSAPATIGAADDDAFTARFVGQPQGEVVSRQGPLTTITVRPLPGAGMSLLGRSHWDMYVPTRSPTRLTLIGSSGAVVADLTRVSLEDLVVDSGSGAFSADLPGVGTVYSAAVSGGSGHMEVRVAPGASVDMEARFRSGGGGLFVGEGTDMRLRLWTGSGAVSLDLPDTAPIRLRVADDGSGRLSVPGFLVRRSGTGDTGVWESRNLEVGGRVIEVEIVAAGSGAITIR